MLKKNALKIVCIPNATSVDPNTKRRVYPMTSGPRSVRSQRQAKDRILAECALRDGVHLGEEVHQHDLIPDESQERSQDRPMEVHPETEESKRLPQGCNHLNGHQDHAQSDKGETRNQEECGWAEDQDGLQMTPAIPPRPEMRGSVPAVRPERDR